MLDTFQKIDDLQEFNNKIKHEAIRCFLMSYKNSKEFIDTYNNTLLKIEDVEFEAKTYLMKKSDGYYIDSEQIDNLIRDVYKFLVFKILSKLVDEGIFELCWDSDTMNFLWRKKKYARINKWKNK
jgi:hypothetical protein